VDDWTIEMVAERLAEAAAVIRRLPPVRVPGYFNTWPPIVVEFADRVGQQADPHRGDPAIFWDRHRWQAFCVSCHGRKTAAQDGGFGNRRRQGDGGS
jgi:hypothetical protein